MKKSPLGSAVLAARHAFPPSIVDEAIQDLVTEINALGKVLEGEKVILSMNAYQESSAPCALRVLLNTGAGFADITFYKPVAKDPSYFRATISIDPLPSREEQKGLPRKAMPHEFVGIIMDVLSKTLTLGQRASVSGIVHAL